jgi:hypothetical protein
MSISGANMERVVRARDHHNSTCPLGPAIEVHLNPADVERCGWDEGDEIGGLLVISSSEQTAGTLKVVCAGEKLEVEEAVAAEDGGFVTVGGIEYATGGIVERPVPCFV